MKYFISDTHFGHKNLIDNRQRLPFLDIDEYDAHMIDCINSTVSRTDILYHLGDYAWKDYGKYRQKIRCKHIMICRGNHDKHMELIKTFGNYELIRHIKLDCRKKVALCHYPMVEWSQSRKGSLHLYGHCHSNREEELNSIWPDRKSMDMGVDNIYRLTGRFNPLSESQVLEFLHETR